MLVGPGTDEACFVCQSALSLDIAQLPMPHPECEIQKYQVHNTPKPTSRTQNGPHLSKTATSSQTEFGSATPAVPEPKSSRTKWMQSLQGAGRSCQGWWRLANGPPGTGSSACFNFHPLGAPQPPSHPQRTTLHRHHQWRRREPVCAGDPLAFSGSPLRCVARPAPEWVCGRGGGGGKQKPICIVFFSMFWVSSVCSSCMLSMR